MLGGCRRSSEKQAPKASPVRPAPVRQTAARVRPVYPYSIVPGGIGSTAELQRAILTDALVAAHYSRVQVQALKPVKLEHDLKAYVSFRMHGKVYWTSRKVKLSAGETVFDGGEIGVRGRCGNQVSEKPRSPVLPNRKEEPTTTALDTPVASIEPAYEGESSRTSAPATLPFEIDRGNANTPPTLPGGNLGWSAPVATGASRGSAVSSGSGGDGAGGGGGGAATSSGAGSGRSQSFRRVETVRLDQVSLQATGPAPLRRHLEVTPTDRRPVLLFRPSTSFHR